MFTIKELLQFTQSPIAEGFVEAVGINYTMTTMLNVDISFNSYTDMHLQNQKGLFAHNYQQ